MARRPGAHEVSGFGPHKPDLVYALRHVPSGVSDDMAFCEASGPPKPYVAGTPLETRHGPSRGCERTRTPHLWTGASRVRFPVGPSPHGGGSCTP